MRISACLIATATVVVLTSSASAETCFGKDYMKGTLNAGAQHPTFVFELDLGSMRVIDLAGHRGVISSLDCYESGGVRKIDMTVAADHLTYECEGIIEGDEILTSDMDCPGRNGSKNDVSVRFSRN